MADKMKHYVNCDGATIRRSRKPMTGNKTPRLYMSERGFLIIFVNATPNYNVVSMGNWDSPYEFST
jgi:hypothetical protein